MCVFSLRDSDRGEVSLRLEEKKRVVLGSLRARGIRPGTTIVVYIDGVRVAQRTVRRGGGLR